MASKVKYPIRLKLIGFMVVVTVVSTVTYLALAYSLFYEDKKSLVMELNASSVKTLAAEVEATLDKYIDKLKLLTQGHQNAEWTKSVFEAEPDLISYELYRQSSENGEWKVSSSTRNADYLKMYGLDPAGVDRLRELVPVPFARAIAQGAVIRNSTVPGGAPILTLAVQVNIAGDHAPFVAVIDLRLDHLLKRVAREGIATLYIVDEEGRVVAHPDMDVVQARSQLGEIELVREAVDSRAGMKTKSFEYKGAKYLGAYAGVGIGGASVISQVAESEAFRAMRRLIEKSLLFATLIITISIILSRAISRNLVAPIEKLLRATARMARWEFVEPINVKTRDEISLLARAFNAMAMDLQRQHKELKSSNEELERKVRERTALLEEEKRRASESQDSLLRTTQLASLGELAGSAAHEVLNPINNINLKIEKLRTQDHADRLEDLTLSQEILASWDAAYRNGGLDKLKAELEKKSEDDRPLAEEDLENLISITADELKRLQEQKETFEFITKEISRVTRIVNNMRSLSRVGGERRAVDIHQALDDTISALTDFAAEKKVELIKEYSGDSRDQYLVTADTDELVQVFSNVIRNAAYAVISAGRRAGSIRIRTERAGDRVLVRIVDNGTGIAEEHLGRIFEPDFTTKSLEDGTGLGLSISRRIARAFGGDIEVEATRKDEGTTFLIWFPAQEVA